MKELELLVSDDCPKEHPFDLRMVDMAMIKREFPEFAPKPIYQSGAENKYDSNNQFIKWQNGKATLLDNVKVTNMPPR